MEFPSTVSDPCGAPCPGLVLCTQHAAVSGVIELSRTGKGQRSLRTESCTSVRVSRAQTEGVTFLITGLNLFCSEEDGERGGGWGFEKWVNIEEGDCAGGWLDEN